MSKTNIEWATHTTQVMVGCTKCSPGCRNCYAVGFAHRLSSNPKLSPKVRASYAKAVTVDRDDKPAWAEPAGGDGSGVVEIPDWRERMRRTCTGRGKTIFVESMGDLFHQAVPFDLVDEVMGWITANHRHRFIILTKRPDRMREYFTALHTRERGQDIARKYVPRYVDPDYGDEMWDMMAEAIQDGPLPNLVLGVTACNQSEWDAKVSTLAEIPAAVRLVSYEPALGPVRGGGLLRRIGWVVAGGENGSRARPAHPDWFGALRDECRAANVPFFFKGWGAWQVASYENGHYDSDMKRNNAFWVFPDGRRQKPSGHREGWDGGEPCAMVKVGKKAAGRLLDGQTWDQAPGGALTC